MAVGRSTCPTHSYIRVCTQPDGNTAGPGDPRRDSHVIEGDESSGVRKWLTGASETQYFDGVGEPSGPRRPIDPERSKLLVDVSKAETENHSPAGQLIHDCHIRREPHRVVQGSERDASAEFDPVGGRCHCGEQHKRAGQVRVVPAVVLADPERVEAGLLGGLRQCDCIAIPMAGGGDPWPV